MDIHFGLVEKVMSSLRQALLTAPKNDLERDGVIQRFEYTFELVWKTGKRVLHKAGLQPQSPRAVIRDLAQQGFIESAEIWMTLLEARNYTSHTYNESTAQWVFSQCPIFLSQAEILIEKLKAETNG